MSEPRIVVAGSADSSRSDYRPPVDIDGARRAARELGIALARARNRIVVYHQAFIEGDVVAGYASVADAPERGSWSAIR